MQNLINKKLAEFEKDILQVKIGSDWGICPSQIIAIKSFLTTALKEFYEAGMNNTKKGDSFRRGYQTGRKEVLVEIKKFSAISMSDGRRYFDISEELLDNIEISAL